MLCNGANLAYKKSIFRELNGFEGNSHISSGDDIFLMEKAYYENTLMTYSLYKTPTVPLLLTKGRKQPYPV